MGEIIAQVIGQAGPALQLARDTLSANGHSNGAKRKAPREGAAEDQPAAAGSSSST
jgi:hypothetical protein